MGRATLEYLRTECNIDINRDVVCFSSTAKDILLRDGLIVKSNPLENIKAINQIDGIFHFAFLTRDYVSKLGNSKYLEINNKILFTMDKFLNSADFNWIVSVSSGAVYDPGTTRLAQNADKNPYGFLKLKEEELLTKITESTGANSVIGRLWAASGLEMPIDRKYAFSDFIVQALVTRTIRITSDREVWRRYIDATDFISILHKMALSGQSEVLDSTGSLVELATLASMVAQATESTVSRPKIDTFSVADKYFPDGLVMSEKAESFGITLRSMQEQVERTIAGHVQNLPRYLKENKVE